MVRVRRRTDRVHAIPLANQIHAVIDGLSARGTALAAGVLLTAAVFVAHWPAIHADVIWDDDVFLFECPVIHAPDGLYRIWFTTQASDYWPLTHTMFWLEWRIWGDNPMPYHAGNLVLHALAGLLLWRLLRRLGLGEIGAYLAALLFAVHPVTVETVAWISERKNVLSFSLYLLAILAYLRFEDRGSRRWYVLALAVGAAALLAKVSVVTLPLVLLLCAWWRRGRLSWTDLRRSLPFFGMSLVMGLLEMWFVGQQIVQAGGTPRPEGLLSRVATSGWAVWFYLYKIVWPFNLSMVYPRWEVDGSRVLSFVPLALLIVCFAAFWHWRKSWGRFPLVGLGYFVIVLGPVLGLLSMSFCQYSLVADHLQYVAMPGIIALAGGVLGLGLQRARTGGRPAVGGASVLIGGLVVFLGVMTWRQARVYESCVSLWTQTIEVNDRSWVAHHNRGLAYARQGRYDLAILDFTKPNHAEAYYNLGNTYGALGQDEVAAQEYTKAIEVKPDYAEAFNNRGNTHRIRGYIDLALADYTRAIELKEGFETAYANRGQCYRSLGDPARAAEDYTKAIELNRNSDQYYNNRGNAYNDLGEFRRAVHDYTQAAELNPGFAEAYHNRAMAYMSLKEYPAAWGDLEHYQQLGGTPDAKLARELTEAINRVE